MTSAILQLIPRLDTGGAERTCIDVAGALWKNGLRALVASEGGRLEEDLRVRGGELITLSMASKSPARILANARVLERLIASHDVKLIHARSRAPAWSGLIAARRAKIPFITTYHGFYSARSPLKRWYNSVMVRGEAVIANSQFTASHIEKEYPARKARIVTIPRGVDEEVFDPARISTARAQNLRAHWGVSPRDILVLLPGRLTRWKGQRILIEAMAQLDVPGVRAVLAGDAQGRGSYEDELSALISRAGLDERVILAGHVADMAGAYTAADIVVSCSVEPEAFGRVAAEAAAMGRPVIATDHGGARETVIAGETGFLIPAGDASALAEALTRLLRMGPQERARLGEAGRQHVLARFTRTRMCADTLKLYAELAQV